MRNSLLYTMSICAKSGNPEAFHHETATKQIMGSEKLKSLFLQAVQIWLRDKRFQQEITSCDQMLTTA